MRVRISKCSINKCKFLVKRLSLYCAHFQAIPAPNYPPENISGYAAFYLAKNHDQAAYRTNLHSDYHLEIFKKLLELDKRFATNDNQLAFCLKYSPTLKFIQVPNNILQ